MLLKLKIKRVKEKVVLRPIEGGRAKPPGLKWDYFALFRKNKRWEQVKDQRARYVALNPRVL